MDLETFLYYVDPEKLKSTTKKIFLLDILDLHFFFFLNASKSHRGLDVRRLSFTSDFYSGVLEFVRKCDDIYS